MKSTNKIIRKSEMVQGSDKWLEWRNNGIGGSDAPVIVEALKSTVHSNYGILLMEKVTRRRLNKELWDGVKVESEICEDVARSRLYSKLGYEFTPCCVEGDEPFRVSLDGLDETHGVFFEHKIIPVKAFDKYFPSGSKVGQKDRVRDFLSVYENYKCQVLYTCEVLGIKKFVFAVSKWDSVDFDYFTHDDVPSNFYDAGPNMMRDVKSFWSDVKGYRK